MQNVAFLICALFWGNFNPKIPVEDFFWLFPRLWMLSVTSVANSSGGGGGIGGGGIGGGGIGGGVTSATSAARAPAVNHTFILLVH